jgi:hypothetical protein
MSEPGCLEPGFVFLRRTGAPRVKSYAWPAILIRVDAELRDAKRNPLPGSKVASAEYAGPFFVPMLPVAAELVANAPLELGRR